MDQSSKTYYAALYLRLSKDDEGLNESASIQTQRKILTSYANENGYLVYNEYVDDGYSGTDFDRPAFKSMLKDIESGYINMVITKDLSRLGRDYITSGEYTERYFPEHNVRYIAINDGYDSISPYNDIAPFKHVVNEMYARDISKKIRSAFQSKIKEGSFIGNFAPYGYMKDPNNKNQLIIDQNSSLIVKEIFEKSSRGERPIDIAKKLNERDILTPAQYRCSNRPYLNINNYSKRKEWTSGMVYKILNNMVYLGWTVQGKTTKVSHKSKVTLINQKEEWVIVKNTHEQIVSKHLYDMVHKVSTSRKNLPTKGFENVFSGIAKCADCERNMSTTGTRKKDSIANLVCGGYKLYGSKECSNHFIDYDTLYNVVLNEINKHINLTQDERKEIVDAAIKASGENNHNNEKLNVTKRDLESRIKELDVIIQKLYEDNLIGKISDDIFLRLMKNYESEQKEVITKLTTIKNKIEESKETIESIKEYFKLLDSFTKVEILSPEIVHRFIDKIEVSQGNFINKHKYQKIKIHFKFIGNIYEINIA
jgi:site-specific DNA recombinase